MNIKLGDHVTRLAHPLKQPPLENKRAIAPANPTIHVVGKNERIGDVVKQYHVRTDALLAANRQHIQNPALPLVEGDALVIPHEQADRLAPYTVANGETLADIVARYRLDPQQVAVDNGLAEEAGFAHVYPGDTLLLGTAAMPADGDPPEQMSALPYADAQQRSLFALGQNFDTFDAPRPHQSADGIVSEQDLHYIHEHPEQFGGTQSDVYLAAEYYLGTPDAWGQLDQAAGQGGTDKKVSAVDLAIVMGGQTPPVGMTAEQMQVFVGTQIVALDRAIQSGALTPQEASERADTLLLAATHAANGDEASILAVSRAAASSVSLLPEQRLTAIQSVIANSGLTFDQVDRVLQGLQPEFQRLLDEIGILYSIGEETALDSLRGQAYQQGLSALFNLSAFAGPAGNAALAQAIASVYPAGQYEQPPGNLLASVAFIQAAGDGAAIPLLNALAPALEAAGKSDINATVAESLVAALTDPLSGDIQAYVALTEQYYFALQMRPTFASDADFNAALSTLMTQQLGADWQQQIDQATQALAAEGGRLLGQIMQLQQFDLAANGLLNDPEAQFAISLALSNNPALTTGPQGQQLLEAFAAIGLSGAPGPTGESPHPLAALAAEAYVRNNALLPMSDPALTPETRLQLLEQAMANNAALAQLLGTNVAQLNAFISDLASLPLPAQGVPPGPEMAEALQGVVDGVNELGLSADSNRVFRGLALGFSLSNTWDAVGGFYDDPSFASGIGLLVDVAGLGVSGAEFATAMRLLPESAFFTGLGRALYVVGAGMAALDALGRIGAGDWAGASLNGVIAGGLLYAGASGGPAGIVVAAVAQIALLGYDSWRQTQYSNRFQNEAQRDFLAASVFGPVVAAALYDTSGNAASPVPMILNYCSGQGLTLEQTAAYLNYLAQQKLFFDGNALNVFRDGVHRRLDKNGSDPFDFSPEQLDQLFQSMPGINGGIMTPAEWLQSQH